jgi:hypothetical protein
MMQRFLPVVAIVGICGVGDATAQDMPLRAGQPAMAADGAQGRDERAVTLAPSPSAADPARLVTDRFSAAYTRAGRPRIVVFWNRELTDDVASGTEEVTTLSADSNGQASVWQKERPRRRGVDIDAEARADQHLDAELRTRTQRIDAGRRTTPHGEAADFDIERGFTDALAKAGAQLLDRTALLRSGALDSGTGNAQAIETRALLNRADWTLEVVAMGNGRWRIVARDVANGRIVAQTASTGQPPTRVMPWIAGERGFVRATPRAVGFYDVGCQLAVDAMLAIAK